MGWQKSDPGFAPFQFGHTKPIGLPQLTISQPAKSSSFFADQDPTSTGGWTTLNLYGHPETATTVSRLGPCPLSLLGAGPDRTIGQTRPTARWRTTSSATARRGSPAADARRCPCGACASKVCRWRSSIQEKAGRRSEGDRCGV